MLDGPYNPRVVPLPSSGSSSPPVASPSSGQPSLQPSASASQWSRIAGAPPPPPAAAAAGLSASSTNSGPAGLQRVSDTPCGIPWNRLYSSSTAPPLLPHQLSHAVSPAQPPLVSSSALLGRAATLEAYEDAEGHRYHSDEAVPHTPPSFLNPDPAMAQRYRRLAEEHPYGAAAAPLSASASARPAAVSQTPRHSEGSQGGAGRRDAQANAAEKSTVQLQRHFTSRHNGFREGESAPPYSSRSRHQTPFSRTSSNGSQHRQRVAGRSDQKEQQSTRASRMETTKKGEESRSSSVSAHAAASSVRGKERRGGTGEDGGGGRSRSRDMTGLAGTRVRDGPPSRRRTHSTSPAPSAPRTAQWAVKIIDDMVAQVAVQQVSSLANPVVVVPVVPPSSSLPSQRGSARRRGSVHTTAVSAGQPAAAANTTVADLTTSFLTSRYGALKWRPILQDFAVCLHRYHSLSPTCAVFRDYFIHVNADMLSDFQLFCRLYAAADIAHCTSVEVRRVALASESGSSGGCGVAHTMVSRRYLDLREVGDRLQRMLRSVVLLQPAPCLVVGEGPSARLPPAGNAMTTMESSLLRGNGQAPRYRYARGPPAHTALVPQRRRLTPDEIRAVRKVVVTWVEDAVEAEERERAEAWEEAPDAASSDHDGGAGRGAGRRRDAAAALRHAAFDRPGQVDAYAFLQATVEAVKLLCVASPVSQTESRRQGNQTLLDSSSTDEDDADDGEAEGDGEERAWAPYPQHEEEKEEGAATSAAVATRAEQQAAWRATTAANARSPLIRRVLQSPPGAYAYPIGSSSSGGQHVSSSLPTPSPMRYSPQHNVSHGGAAHVPVRGESELSSADEDMDDEGEVSDSPSQQQQQQQHHYGSRTPRRDGAVPSYQQPRQAHRDGGLAAHRSLDGRLWSPPRDGVVRRLGQPTLPATRHDRASAGEAVSPPRTQQQQQQRHSASHRHRNSVGDEEEWGEVAAQEPTYHTSPNSRKHMREARAVRDRDGVYRPSSSSRHATPHDAHARSPTASPERGDAFYANPSMDAAPTPYVADLHAERRWREMQQQVAAAARRDAQWRQHPRIQARLRQEEQEEQQLYDMHIPHVHSSPLPTATTAKEPSAYATRVTVDDIERELQRREQSRWAAHGDSAAVPSAPPHSSTSPLYLRDPLEAAQYAHQQIRLVPPPSLPPPILKAGTQATAAAAATYRSRVLPAEKATAQQHGQQQIPKNAEDVPSNVKTTAGTSHPPKQQQQQQQQQRGVSGPTPTPSRVASTGSAPHRDPAVTRETVCLTDEEQAMLDQLEAALHRLDVQHRHDKAAAAAAMGARQL